MAHALPHTPAAGTGPVDQFDAIIIGAGIAGLYQLYQLRQLGLAVRVYDDGSGVGGPQAYRAKCDEVAAKGYEGFLLQ